MNIRKLMTILVIAFAVTFPVSAQTDTFETDAPTLDVITATPTADATLEVTPEMTVEPDDNIPPTRIEHEYAVDIIINTIVGLIMSAFGSAPITVVLVSILKKIPALNSIPAATITFVTAAVLYVLLLVASLLGMEVQFENLLQMIVVAAPAVMSFLGTLIFAPAQYHVAKAADVPIIGDSREPRIINFQDFSDSEL